MAERWAKVPGWQYEASDRGVIRSLRSGRTASPTHFTACRVGISLLGSDERREDRGHFNRASVIYAAFHGTDPRQQVRPKDGDLFNARLENLELNPEAKPTKLKTDGPPGFAAPVDAAAAEQCRLALSRLGVDSSDLGRCMAGVGYAGSGLAWASADKLITALAAVGISTATIGGALGVRPYQITKRKKALGLTSQAEGLPDKLPGEIWRPIVGYRAAVSNLGRVRLASGMIVLGTTNGKPRRRVTILSEADGKPKAVTVASAVLHAFRGASLNAKTRPLNGDGMDARLENLAVGRMPARPGTKRHDPPWTREQDRALRKVSSWVETARVTGHSLTHCKNRMKVLGISLDTVRGSRPGVMKTLDHRDLALLQDAVALLTAAGLDDRTINWGMRIVTPPKGHHRGVPDAAMHCAIVLHETGWLNPRIATAMGVAPGTVGKYLQRAGLSEPWPEGYSTKAGPIDPRQGEEWRDVPGLPYIVSNHGRVANQRGDLMAQVLNPANRYHVVLRDPTRSFGRYTCLVSRLVLLAFKPELSARAATFMDGDHTNITPENIVPTRTANLARQAARAGPTSAPVVQARGNLGKKTVGPVEGSVPYYEPLWAEANKVCPAMPDRELRRDIISDMVMLYLEGRAKDMRGTLALAKRERSAMGAWREQSLDASLGSEGTFSLMDLLNDEGEIVSHGRA